MKSVPLAAQRVSYSLEVDEHGHFEQLVPDGLYQVYPTCIVNNGGHQFVVDLAPLGKVHVDQSSDKGIVADFRLVMDGLRPDADPNGRDAWFGGDVQVGDANHNLGQQLNDRYPGSKVQVTFQPLGPLIDGSTAPSFMLEAPTSSIVYSTHFRRLPIGSYRATVVLITADAQTKPLLASLGTSNTFNQTVEIFWQDVAMYQNPQREEPIVYVRE
jgi:hypothetical protein